MTDAFTWLNQLMTWLGKWVPRVPLVPPTHRGVIFGPKGGCRKCGPGLVVYWPITHMLLQVPITTQSFQLNPQILPLSAPGNTNNRFGIPTALICGAAIQYRVVDVVKAATSALHLHALVDNRTSAAIAKFAPNNDPSEWSRLAYEYVCEELKGYGVQLERLDPTQQAIGIAVKNLSDWGYNDTTDGSNALSGNK